MRKWFVAACFVTVFWGIVGCGPIGGESLVRNYYTLDYQPHVSPTAESERPYPFVLEIGRFAAHRATNRVNIVYRYSPHQLQYYERERWAVRPDDMLRDVVLKHVDAARLTKSLGTEFLDVRPDFRIDGSIEALERLGAGDVYFGHLAMTLRVNRVETREDVWSYSFDRRSRVHSPEMVHTVSAISNILQSEMSVVVAQLDSLFLAASRGEELTPASAAKASTKPAATSDPPRVSDVDESSFEIIREP